MAEVVRAGASEHLPREPVANHHCDSKIRQQSFAPVRGRWKLNGVCERSRPLSQVLEPPLESLAHGSVTASKTVELCPHLRQIPSAYFERGFDLGLEVHYKASAIVIGPRDG